VVPALSNMYPVTRNGVLRVVRRFSTLLAFSLTWTASNSSRSRIGLMTADVGIPPRWAISPM